MTQLDRAAPLDADVLRAQAGKGAIGRRIILHEEVSSTNDCVWQLTRDGEAEGVVVFAERQTAGRGQRGNSWESAARKGLWLSILLRPAILPAESARLTSWAAQTIAGTISQELQLPAIVKQPNDVLLENRKVAGVLVEMRVEANGDYAAIIGIGVNVNHEPTDFSAALRTGATSLALAAGRAINRTDFAGALLQNLNQSYCERFG